MSADVRDVPEANRYEISVDGERAGFAEYRLRGQRITFTHTEVRPEMGGRGLAGQLVRYALADARQRGLSVRPLCPYVRKVIADHPDDYLDLVPAEERARFQLPMEG